MTDSKLKDAKLAREALASALTLADMLERSAREGSAQIDAMTEEEIDMLLAQAEGDRAGSGVLRILAGVLAPLVPGVRAELADSGAVVGRFGAAVGLAQLTQLADRPKALSWVSGPLRIEAAYVDEKRLSSVRLSIEAQGEAHSSASLVHVRLSDRTGAQDLATLSVDQPSTVLRMPNVSGAFGELEVLVSLGETDQK